MTTDTPRVELRTEEDGHGTFMLINGKDTGYWFSDTETAALRARFTFDEQEPEPVTITIPRDVAERLVANYQGEYMNESAAAYVSTLCLAAL